jgi:hypothetical protein
MEQLVVSSKASRHDQSGPAPLQPFRWSKASDEHRHHHLYCPRASSQHWDQGASPVILLVERQRPPEYLVVDLAMEFASSKTAGDDRT